MKYAKWTGLAGTTLLIVSVFLPWVTISSRSLVITGLESAGTNYGSPGLLSVVFVSLYVLFSFIPRLWANWAAVIAAAMNSAWVIRNFLLLATCRAYECPVRETGFYLMILGSAVVLLSSLFPDTKSGSVRNR